MRPIRTPSALSALTVATIFAALLLLGFIACQSGPIAKTPLPGIEKGGVVVRHDNGGRTIYLPTADNKDAYVLTGQGSQECATCKAASIKFFQGGELDTKCPTCGGIRSPIQFSDQGHN